MTETVYKSTMALDHGARLPDKVSMRIPQSPPNRIRQWRQRCGLSLEALAQLVGSSNQTIGRYERGERSVTIDVLLQLAPALGCKPADLLPDPGSVLSEDELQLSRICSELDVADRSALLRIAKALADSRGNDEPQPRLQRTLK